MNKTIVPLSLIALSIWISIFSIDSNLHIIACDVGQGDAILIQKNTTQILIDSGPNNKVVDCLGTYMPFWDKTIELGILTHSDNDHSGGYPDVFKIYKIENFLTNDLNKPVFGKQDLGVLRNLIKNPIFPKDGMTIRVGAMHLDILHPSVDFVSNSTNDYSIVNLLRYGNFKAIFTGDIEDNVSDLVSTNSKIQTVNYLKVPHHGSKNGLSEKLLEVLRPDLAVISSKKNNSYGHPHAEVLELLARYALRVLRTDQLGDVEVITDGVNFWAK